MLAPSLEGEARSEATTEADFADGKRLSVVIIMPSRGQAITFDKDILTLRETVYGREINIACGA